MHAIVFVKSSQDSAPEADATERPGKGEYGMMSPIRVRPRLPYGKLSRMARINFYRTYTVEHNLKVYDFGNVHEDYMSHLTEQREYVKNVMNGQIALPNQGDNQEEQQEEEEEEEDAAQEIQRKLEASSLGW
jgi:hypothetical protein